MEEQKGGQSTHRGVPGKKSGDPEYGVPQYESGKRAIEGKRKKGFPRMSTEMIGGG